MDPLVQGLNDAAIRLLEVKLENEKDKTWVMEEGLKAVAAALRAKKIEHLVLLREKEKLEAVLDVGERLANAFFRLEADGNLNFDYQNAIKEAMEAWIISFESFSRIRGGNNTGGGNNGGGV